jgi:hypothetical protein
MTALVTTSRRTIAAVAAVIFVAAFPASADEQRSQFVSVGADELAEGHPLEFPASLPHAVHGARRLLS